MKLFTAGPSRPGLSGKFTYRGYSPAPLSSRKGATLSASIIFSVGGTQLIKFKAKKYGLFGGKKGRRLGIGVYDAGSRYMIRFCVDGSNYKGLLSTAGESSPTSMAAVVSKVNGSAAISPYFTAILINDATSKAISAGVTCGDTTPLRGGRG